jgi:hypothetical protein
LDLLLVGCQASKIDCPDDLRGIQEKKNRTVHDALANNRWIVDVSIANFTVEHISQFITLWGLLQDVALLEGTPNTISWTLTTDGVYYVGSAYKVRF